MKRMFVPLLALALLAGGFLWSRGSSAQPPAIPVVSPGDEGSQLAQPSADMAAPVPGAEPHRVAIRTPAAPGRRLAGARVSGRVLDALGGTVRDVEVRLEPTAPPYESGAAERVRVELGRTTRTDAQGRYSFGGVVNGHYDLGGVGRMWSKMNPVLEDRLIEGDLTHDFELGGELVLAGRVEQAYAAPLALALTPATWEDPDRPTYHWSSIRKLVLERAGEFRFEGLEPGSYLVRANSRGHGGADFEFALVQSITDARLVLERGLTLAGAIEREYEHHDRLGITVYIELEDALGTYWRQNTTTEGPRGAFRFEGLVPGTYKLSLRDTVIDEPNRDISRELTVQFDDDREDFRYTMEDDFIVWIDARVPVGAAQSTGRVTASSGDVTMSLRMRVSGRGTGTGFSQLTGSWGHHGEIEVWSELSALKLALPRGVWGVRVELLGYEPWAMHLDLSKGSVVDHFVEAVLVPGEGRLVQADIDSDHYRVERRSSNSDEAWELILSCDKRWAGTPKGITQAWLEPGTHDLRITSLEHPARVLREVVVASLAEPLIIEAALAPGVGIAGTIETTTGVPYQRASLFLERLEAGTWVRMDMKKHSSRASFHFRGLLPGTYRAVFHNDEVAATWELGAQDLVDQTVVRMP